jgi:NIMA (never in mitosis gene a)-related kinase
MSEEERKSTFIEAKILSKLDHPSIIKFREVFISKKPRYTLNLVTEFAEGGDLQSKLKARKGKPFPENQILDWFTQICLGIKHIHDRKIIHRDLKSQNIFLGESGLIKIGDFGIAKCLEWTWQKAATLVGTPYYLSPEIVQNQPYSFKSDVWSLGVLLYEMVTLKMPFDATSLPMLSIRIIKGNFNPVPQSFSKELRNLINNMLTVDCNRRPSINDLLSI